MMLNFQVHSMDETIQHLEQIGVPLAKNMEVNEFGKFVWIKDPDGRLIELWEKIMISDEHGEPQFEQKKIDRVRAPLQ